MIAWLAVVIGVNSTSNAGSNFHEAKPSEISCNMTMLLYNTNNINNNNNNSNSNNNNNEIITYQVEKKITFIGRAKRASHWGVQSRFRVIYI